MPNEFELRAERQHKVNHYCCAQCHGPLTQRTNDCGRTWYVECVKRCQPGGFVTKEHAERWRARNLADAAEVAGNYPQLAPERTTTAAAARAALYGEGD